MRQERNGAMKSDVTELLLVRITRHIAEGGWAQGTRLPPRGYWATLLGISLPHVDRLLHALDARKVVSVLPRKGVFVGAGSIPDPANLFAARIKAQIESGQLRISQQFPSYKELQSTCKLSPTTISAALRMLEEQKLIHRSGKKIFVGADRAVSADACVKRIVIVPPSSAYLSRILDQSSPYYTVMRHFLDDVSRQGIEIRTIAMQGNEFDRTLRKGRLDLREDYHRRRGRDTISYLYISNRLGTWKGSDIYDSLFFLKEFGSPVVWLDLDRLYLDDRRRLPPGYCVVHENHERPVRALCDCLEQLGHRVLALVIPFYLNDYCAERMSVLERDWRARGGEFQIRTIQTRSPWFLERVDCENLAHHKGIPFFIPRPAAVSYMRAHGLPGLRNFLSSRTQWEYIYKREALLIENGPLLARALDDNRVSCLIAPDGYSGCVCRQWLRYQEIRVPEDISVVAFDGQDFASTEGLTTVDQHAAMGYALARLCIGDIAFEKNRLKVAVISPQIRGRTSLGPPPRNVRSKLILQGEVVMPGADPFA